LASCARRTVDFFVCELAQTGTHTILVEDWNGLALGEYLLAIQRLNDPVGCEQLSPGRPRPGRIDPPGQTDCWRFAGVAGDGARIRVKKTSTGQFEPVVGVFDPDGDPIAPCQRRTVDDFTCPLTETGTHTILVEDWNGLALGDYSIQFGDDDVTAPTIALRTPPDGATYTLGQDVRADYECADEAGGSGLASCAGAVTDGAGIDTGSVGDKEFKVVAEDRAGNASEVTHRYRVAARDFSAPRVEIRMPQAGAAYPHHAAVLADYECADEAGGSGLQSCAGPVADGEPIDTATVGEKRFRVIARDNAGNQTTVGVGYQVVDVAPPTIILRTPPDGATYAVGQAVHADYECADESGGSGLASCTGTAAHGAPIDTSSAGDKTFTVTAKDQAGNSSVVTHRYNVTVAVDADRDGVPDANDRSVVTQPPQPEETAIAQVKRGTVLILERGRFRPLQGEEIVQIGATIDATAGAIVLTVAADTAGALQSGTFSEGIFEIGQLRAEGNEARRRGRARRTR
ncbi:MAG: hypothetical protein ACRDPR_22495, partial [Nocardioidaceae bacterium]